MNVFKAVKGPWRVVSNKRYGTLGIVGNDNRRVANHKRAKMEWLYKTDPRSFAEAHLTAIGHIPRILPPLISVNPPLSRVLRLRKARP
jgi:hypothetical protein